MTEASTRAHSVLDRLAESELQFPIADDEANVATIGSDRLGSARLNSTALSRTGDQYASSARKMVREIAVDRVRRSTSRKIGGGDVLARIDRIRWDEPAHEADTLQAREKLPM